MTSITYSKMQYTVLVLVAMLSITAAMSNAFMKGLGGKAKAPSTPKAAAAPAARASPARASPAAAAPKTKKKDMTWGGRPDPTPELYVDEGSASGGWLNAGWRYNRK